MVDYAYYLIVAVIGLIGLSFGSFLSVVLFRLDIKSGILTGRSECPQCLAKLRWYDLIPLLSFLLLKGKCRYCQKNISSIYLAMELSMTAAFMAYYFFNGPYLTVADCYNLILIFIFLALTFFDYRYFILPDKLVLTGLGLVIIYMTLLSRDSFVNNLISGLVAASFFAIIYLISRGEWLGFGDVKLAFLIGFVLGYPLALLSIIGAVWAGALWGLVLILMGRANSKTALPFGSFLGSSTVLFLVFGNYAKEIFEILFGIL